MQKTFNQKNKKDNYCISFLFFQEWETKIRSLLLSSLLRIDLLKSNFFFFSPTSKPNIPPSRPRLPNLTRLLATGAEFVGIVPEERLDTLSIPPSNPL